MRRRNVHIAGLNFQLWDPTFGGKNGKIQLPVKAPKGCSLKMEYMMPAPGFPLRQVPAPMRPRRPSHVFVEVTRGSSRASDWTRYLRRMAAL